MKTTKIIMMVLALSVVYQFAEAQNTCQGNKVKMSKGFGGGCGCHCQKKCVSPGDVQTYLNNGWNYGDCWGNCCWIRAGEDASIETSLTEIYPNPASGNVNIAFTLSQPGEVILEVFDMTGRNVTTIARTVFEEAGNQVTWDVSEVNPGIYFLKMKAGSYSAIKRISVIK